MTHTPAVDSLEQTLRMALQHIRICAPDPTIDAALEAALTRPPGGSEPQSLRDLWQVDHDLVDEIREIVGLKGKPGSLIYRVSELAKAGGSERLRDWKLEQTSWDGDDLRLTSPDGGSLILSSDARPMAAFLLRQLAIAALASPQGAERCSTCDDTGEVHRADGEWVGSCPHHAQGAEQRQEVPVGHTTDRDGSIVPGSAYDDDERLRNYDHPAPAATQGDADLPIGADEIPRIGNPLMVGLRNPILCTDADLAETLAAIRAERETAEDATSLACDAYRDACGMEASFVGMQAALSSPPGVQITSQHNLRVYDPLVGAYTPTGVQADQQGVVDSIPVADLAAQLRPYADPDCRECDGTGVWMGNVLVCACLLDALPILQPSQPQPTEPLR